MNPPTKRDSSAIDASAPNANKKVSKQWRTPRKNQPVNPALTLNPGDAGIWATCNMHKEAKATGELRDLFEDYAIKMYGEKALDPVVADVSIVSAGDEAVNTVTADDPPPDIEAEIRAELNGMKNARKPPSSQKSSNESQPQPLFQPVRLDIQCVLFFKTRAPVEPVAFVERICRDAADGIAPRRSRCVKRLTPMSRMGKATVEGLDAVGHAVLDPIFSPASTREVVPDYSAATGTEGSESYDEPPRGGEDGQRKKFAIRPSFRNHNTLKRDDVIPQIAKIVGNAHDVDLKGYDYLVLVEFYKNMLGMSVVGNDFERLKRYNLAEIYDPTPKPEVKGKDEPKDGAAIDVEADTSNLQAAEGMKSP